jgi:hypothetical protein
MEQNNNNLGDLYSLYLLTETNFPSCIRFSSITDWKISHDRINLFLEKNNKSGKDLYQEIEKYINPNWWTLHIDDSVTDKIYSYLWKSDLAQRYYSGKHHKIIQWISLLTLFYTDKNWIKVPVDYRIVDKKEWKTKNELFLEMIIEVLNWWLKPSMVTWDSWYSSVGNLNFLIRKEISFLFWLKSNRLVCHKWRAWEFKQVWEADLEKTWEIVYLKWVSFVKIFQEDNSFYAYYNSRARNKKDYSFLDKFSYEDFKKIKKRHWDIENYHRAIKQVCNIEWHRFRNKWAIKWHFFYSLRSFCILEINRSIWKFTNWYEFIFKSTRDIIKNAFDKIELSNLIMVWI